jgi:hypothetical protein
MSLTDEKDRQALLEVIDNYFCPPDNAEDEVDDLQGVQ